MPALRSGPLRFASPLPLRPLRYGLDEAWRHPFLVTAIGRAGPRFRQAGGPGFSKGAKKPGPPSRRKASGSRGDEKSAAREGPSRPVTERKSNMVAIYHWVIDGDAPFDAITEILDYLWEAELTDYEGCPRDGHAFEHLAKVSNWLNSGAAWSPLDYVDARKAGLPLGWRVSATYEKPDARPGPGKGERVPMRDRLPDRRDARRVRGRQGGGLRLPGRGDGRRLEAPDSNDDWALGRGSEEESLAYLLRVVADAYAKEGRDVYTWLFATGGHGEQEVTTIKALHRREAGRLVGLTIMLSWEEDV